MIRRLGAALLLALGMALVPWTAHAAPADDLAVLANQARWANGQAGLVRNSAMDQVAANWAQQLAANGALSHNPNYSTQIPGGWTGAAENVAQGYPSAAAMHDGWMASSGHRANLLGDYTDIGVAFLSAGGTTWGVQVFAKYPGHAGPPPPAPPAPPAPPPPPPAEPAPAPVAEEPTPEATPDDDADADADADAEQPDPTATPTPRATATDAPRDEVTATRGAPGDGGPAPPWWPLPVALALLAGSTAWMIRRRRGGSTQSLRR